MDHTLRLSFIILAHKNPEQLQLLTDKLLASGSAVFIHIDKKSGKDFEGFIARNEKRESLRVYSKYKVYWGSYNQIRATLFLLEQACNGPGFDFVKLLSGQDLPVKPAETLKEYLARHRPNSFLSFYRLPDNGRWAGNGGLDRIELFWITDFPPWSGFLFNKLNVLIHFFQNKLRLRRKWKTNLYGGANWFLLNRDMALYVVDRIKSDRKLLSRFRNTRLADEIFLQTLLLNSEFADRVVNTPFCFIDWQTGPEFPRTYTSADFHRIVESGEFFARKFDLTKDKEVIYKILSAI